MAVDGGDSIANQMSSVLLLKKSDKVKALEDDIFGAFIDVVRTHVNRNPQRRRTC